MTLGFVFYGIDYRNWRSRIWRTWLTPDCTSEEAAIRQATDHFALNNPRNRHPAHIRVVEYVRSGVKVVS